MAARTNRSESLERLDSLYKVIRDRLIPADESVPLSGNKFLDWELQAEELGRSLCAAFMEERIALDATSRVEEGGRCPNCGSDRVYLEKRESKVEVLSPQGVVVMHKQRCRCRSCDRSFSPSGA